MKTVFLVTTLLVLQLNAQTSVDNSVISVDKSYQHQLKCKGSSANQVYELRVNWTKQSIHDPMGRAPFYRVEFNYELTNLTTQQIWSDNYQNFINERTSISETQQMLNLQGSFFMYKRLGIISKTAEITVNKNESQYELNKIKLTAKETFQNSKDYCNPPTRLCGSEPIGNENPVILDIGFENSSCVAIKI